MMVKSTAIVLKLSRSNEKNECEVEQVGSSKGCAHARNKLQLKVFADALATSNCFSLNCSVFIMSEFY
jgi:hypothetical protein